MEMAEAVGVIRSYQKNGALRFERNSEFAEGPCLILTCDSKFEQNTDLAEIAFLTLGCVSVVKEPGPEVIIAYPNRVFKENLWQAGIESFPRSTALGVAV